jgi:hypothetical protein
MIETEEPTDKNIHELELRSVDLFKEGDLDGALELLRKVCELERLRIKGIGLAIEMSKKDIARRIEHIKSVTDKIQDGEAFRKEYPAIFNQ